MSTAKKSIKRINNSSSLPLRLATGGVLGTLAIGGVVAAGTQKDVTVDVNGETIELATFSGDVSGALQAAGVQVGAEDLVSPAPSEDLFDGQTISVRHATPVAVTIDGVEHTMSSTALTVDDFLKGLKDVTPGASVKAAGLDAKAEKLSEGMELEIVSPKFIKVNDGSKITYTRIAAKTVEDVIAERGIGVDEDDRVYPALDTPVTEGMSIKVDQVSTTDYEVVEPFEAEPNYVDDPELEEGTEQVVEPGQPGERVLTHRLIMVDGKKESNEVIKTVETRPATAATIARGTKPSAPAVAAGSVWDTLAMCESTGNWNINTGNGFSGGLQFTPSTWLAFGGGQYAPEAWMASREQQIAVAQNVQAAQGWGAWPACTAKMGLR